VSNLLYVTVVFVMTLFFTGCTGSMVELFSVNQSHTIDPSLTEEQITQALIKGAESAGWVAKDVGGHRILATYQVRVHSVKVQISHTPGYYTYTINYLSSYGTKMFCTERDRKKTRNLRVSGQESCPGDSAPAYIHGNYKKWVDALNTSIQNSLAAM
jgi:hypothetical protein